jgi:glutathione synthase/RimK-type ligase-like ATP-grasp enzyme
MSVLNEERAFIRILRHVAAERGVETTVIGKGWIIRFTKGETVRHAYGYSLDLNSAATHQLACDKAAACEVFASCGVAHVPHHLFLHPVMARYAPHAGNWARMLKTCDDWGWDAVIKENAGTGGRGVMRVRTMLDLEQAVYTLFGQSTSLALSPYVEAPTEVRFVMLDGRCELAFTKTRPSVVGDGRRTALELLADRAGEQGLGEEFRRMLENFEPDGSKGLAVIPAAGSTFLLNWRHNLGQGAIASIIEPQSLPEAHSLAMKAAAALNLRFGSVDVLLTPSGPVVLEANAGVMMEYVSRSLPGGQAIAERIYRTAFDAMFPA